MKKLLTYLALSLMTAAVVQAESPIKKPNVVFVIIDDQGYGDLACTGNPIVKTPAIDALYAESTRLTDYHVSPTCAPTRGALMSGHVTNRAGPWHTIRGRSFLRQSSTTWGEVFSAGGYATGMFGKWHLGDNYPYRPEDRGFQEVVRHGGGGVGQTPDYWDNAYFDDTYFHNSVPQKYEGYCTDVYFSEARRFIKESVSDDKPFLAYISTNAPHSPYLCPEKYWKPYMDKGLTEEEAIFFGMIANVDENVGVMRKWLRDEGLEANTLFVYTTDNGTATGERVFNAGMQGKKNSEYEGGHRVPFFMYWPDGGLTNPKDVDHVTAHIDVLPTLIDLCGLQTPMDYAFDGRSLAPLLYDLPVPWADRTIITDSQRVIDPIKWRKSAVMTDQWRLVNGEELYDIKRDPSQAYDLAAERPEVRQSLRSEYEKWWDSISPGFTVHERVVVGNDAENPSHLTGHDWLAESDDASPWNQGKIRAAKPSGGYWAVKVDQTARYQISLRRWPSELSHPINADLAAGAPVPGLASFRETPGKGIGAKRATLKIGDLTETKPVLEGAEDVRFNVNLRKGDYFLEGIFHTGDSPTDVIGAYYAVVERLD
jgi:arylsulfatase A-like enzyme